MRTTSFLYSMYKVICKRWTFKATHEDAYRRKTLYLHPMYKVFLTRCRFKATHEDPYRRKTLLLEMKNWLNISESILKRRHSNVNYMGINFLKMETSLK